MAAKIAALILTAAALLGVSLPPSAQNLSNSVVSQTVVFGRGKSAAEVTGRARYGISYVYMLDVRQGQTMSVDLKSRTNAVTFSLMAPAAAAVEAAFSITRWSGVLSESGQYRLALVMNDPQRKHVPYRLSVAVH